MKWISPAGYAKSNSEHIVINAAAADDFRTVYQPLKREDTLLDFGTGTGETAAAIAEGTLGKLGQPGRVLGVDINPNMVEHCRQQFSKKVNLDFQTLNAAEDETFSEENAGAFSMVTSFSCLHWVPDQPQIVKFFNRILSPGGKFLFLIVSTHSRKENLHRKIFDDMRLEPKWAEALAPTSWVHIGTTYINDDDWMTTPGYISEGDYTALLEKNGFKVTGSKTSPMRYTCSGEFTTQLFETSIRSAFPELDASKREEFFAEYTHRIRVASNDPESEYLYTSQRDENGSCLTVMDCVQIFGEKVQNI